MRLSVLAVAVGSLSLAAAVSAEPAKAPVRKAVQPSDLPAPVIVASADTVSSPEGVEQQPEQQASEPTKPARHARVTSCRCGDQTPGSN
jgi:hypothetical protein